MRDYTTFPDDDNGNALWRLYTQGVDLSGSAHIDFAVFFTSEAVALQFAVDALLAGHQVSFSCYDDDSTHVWEICLHPYLETTHVAISLYESQLQEQAKEYGGCVDGWDWLYE